MTILIAEWTTNRSPTNIEATLERYNINAKVDILITYPTKRVRVNTAKHYDSVYVQGIVNANTCKEA